jgi:hypothetical protein
VALAVEVHQDVLLKLVRQLDLAALEFVVQARAPLKRLAALLPRLAAGAVLLLVAGGPRGHARVLLCPCRWPLFRARGRP